MGHRKYAWLVPALALVLGLAAGCNNSDSLVFPVLPAPTPADAQTLAGSQVCRTCHQSIYESWEKTRHTKKVRVASLSTVVNDADSDGTNDFVQGGAGITFDVFSSVPAGQTGFGKFVPDPGIEYPKLGWDGANLLLRIGPNTYRVTYVLGGTGKWKQRYMVTIDNQEYISPVQFNEVTRQYVWYHEASWYTISGSRLTGYVYNAGQTPVTQGKVRDSWQRRCIACHTTGVRDLTRNANGEYGASIADMLANTTGPRFSEMPVACEACHGPAKRHVELGGGRGTALNPRTLATDRADEVCGYCHSRGSSVNSEGFGFPWAAGPLVDGRFLPGDVLDDFYVQTTTAFWDDGFQHSKSHHQQWLDHRKTEHAEAGVTCFDCHDPHGSGFEADLKMETTQLCLSCHDGDNDIDSADLSRHTRHQDAEVQNCENCHFTKVAKSAINYDIHSHSYRVIFPADTEASGIPNACAKCHAEDTNEQLTARLEARFPDVRPVAFASSEPSPFGTGFVLDGSKSFDPLGGPLSFDWTFKSGPPSFSSDQLLAPTAESALFVPTAPGNYTFLLVVTNRDGVRSWQAKVTVDVPAGVTQSTPDLRQANYIGSQFCKACHNDNHTNWETTRHPLKVRRPFEGPGVVFADTDGNGTSDWMDGGNPPSFDLADDPDGDNTAWDDISFGSGIEAPKIGFDSTRGVYLVTVGNITYDVTFLLGGTGKWKQRYMVTIDEGEYILPIQYNELTNEWVVYHGQDWYVIDGGGTYTDYLFDTGETPVTEGKVRNSWQRRCTTCHATGMRDMSVDPVTGEYGRAIENMLVATSGPRLRELGVGCEACHGPGSLHAATPTLRGAIVNPAKLSSTAANESCGACHNRGTSVNSEGFGFPWGPTLTDGHFIPGEDIEDYYTSNDEAGGSFWPDPFGHSKQHHQQWLDMRWTEHFTEAGMTCGTCHTSHTDDIAGQLKLETVALCTSCHQGMKATNGNKFLNHSRHFPGQTKCSDCHMPKVAKSAINYDIRSHSWQIIWPQATEDTGIPNSCTACHPGDDPDELQDEINELWGDLVPYAEPRVVDPADSKAKRVVKFTATATFTLDGTKSYDPNGKAITGYAWTLLSAPAGNTAALSNRLAAKPTFTATLPGTYVFQLVVRDLLGTSKPAKVSVTVE